MRTERPQASNVAPAAGLAAAAVTRRAVAVLPTLGAAQAGGAR